MIQIGAIGAESKIELPVPTASAGAKDDAQAQAGGDTQAQRDGHTRWRTTTSRRNS